MNTKANDQGNWLTQNRAVILGIIVVIVALAALKQINKPKPSRLSVVGWERQRKQLEAVADAEIRKAIADNSIQIHAKARKAASRAGKLSGIMAGRGLLRVDAARAGEMAGEIAGAKAGSKVAEEVVFKTSVPNIRVVLSEKIKKLGHPDVEADLVANEITDSAVRKHAAMMQNLGASDGKIHGKIAGKAAAISVALRPLKPRIPRRPVLVVRNIRPATPELFRPKKEPVSPSTPAPPTPAPPTPAPPPPTPATPDVPISTDPLLPAVPAGSLVQRPL